VGEQFTPFLPFGVNGLMATVGLVFVSYAGLTKVASVAEEVQDPDRNIPLGMALSLATATAVYVLGVFVIVAVLEPGELRSDLTPVATAAAAFFDWLPGSVGLILIVVAAIAAFASTGNAGILSASRYPLAMARDRLMPTPFARVGRFGTPTLGVMATAVLMIATIVFLDVEGLAKLASAFQLLLFAMVNLSVIVMREARIEAYDPGFRTPLYPWVQLLGVLGPLWLITELGPSAALMAVVLIGLCIGWYFYYAKRRVRRAGAIFHAFAHYGQRRDTDLDMELRGIVKSKGLREADPFDEVVARARVLEVEEGIGLDAIFDRAATLLGRALGVPGSRLVGEFRKEAETGFLPVARGAALPHARLEDLDRPELLLVRSRAGVEYEGGPGSEDHRVHAIIFLLSPEGAPGQHLRLLGHLASHIDEDGFLGLWLDARDEHALRETLLRDERSFSFRLTGAQVPSLVGRTVAEAELPPGALVALVRRGRSARVPDGSTRLREGDYLTVIGAPEVIEELADRYGREPGPTPE
ncbi:MAG: amino acid permease, partial [Longimicrobiales bacterium]|nr:amino acid permease [Longimicrobiales bacterium]